MRSRTPLGDFGVERFTDQYVRFDAEQDPTRTDEWKRDLLVDLLMIDYPLRQN